MRDNAVHAVDVTVNGVKTAANGVAAGAKYVANGAKKGWETTTQKMDNYCRTHTKELEMVADVSADIALKAALIGVAAICKERERNR